MFINVPYIKSITMGLNLDDMCKQLLWDVCQETGIDCYQLVINPNDYQLRREKLTEESMAFDESKEIAYINLLVEHILSASKKLSDNSRIFIESVEKNSFEINAMINVLTSALDFLSDAYFLKASFNRYCKNMSVQENEIIDNQEITSAIFSINDFVSIAQCGSESIETGLINLLMTRKISKADYNTAKKLLANILELVDKHLELKWFDNEQLIIASKNN